MAQTGSFQSLQVCRIRAARLDATGTPTTGSTNAYVSSALTTVSIQPDYQDGPEIQTENGCGGIAAYYKGPDVLRKINLSFELTNLDIELIELLTTQSIITSGGATIGAYLPRSGACTTVENHGVSLEFWSKRWDGCTAPSGSDATLPYWHWAFPRAILRTGDMQLENGFLRVPVVGYAQENANWGNGPFGDFPGATLESVGAYWADATMPETADTYITVS
jgi:hypothetical protein